MWKDTKVSAAMYEQRHAIYRLARGSGARVSAAGGLAQEHMRLADDGTLSVSERYRQLAAYHVITLDFRRAIQAMWASIASIDRFSPLSGLQEDLGSRVPPLWLASSGDAAAYPRSELDDWLDVEGLADLHAEIARMAISRRVRCIHDAVSHILFGEFGFAVQCLKASELSDECPTLTELLDWNASVDEPPAWLDCWR
ncbi:hypothetical protein [Ralstonia sp. GX3-BWBA]|uniref:hypothetical protein n=1 Tax=Ralstonia sp. GX3-BWBA TaxID=2219865 RepID=UPI001EF8D0E7|nr:hypothetical protein [Ralstonia sp. GX3-BWBA]